MKTIQLMACVIALVLSTGCGRDEAQIESAQQPVASQGQQPGSPRYQPPPTQRARQVEVPAGTELTLALDTALSSETSRPGDSFTATVLEPVIVANQEVIPAGSTVEGRITEAAPAKKGAGNARLGLSFGSLRLTSGYRTAISGSFQEITASKKGRNAAVIGGSAAGGALLGRIIGKDTRSAVIGAIVGGGIGTAVVVGKEREQAVIPADTPFGIRLEQAIELPGSTA